MSDSRTTDPRVPMEECLECMSGSEPCVKHQPEDEIIAMDPPKEWLELWFASREMLQSYGVHKHEGRCESCNAAWDKLYTALLAASRPKAVS